MNWALLATNHGFPIWELDWKKESGEIKLRFLDFSDNSPLSEFLRNFEASKNSENFIVAS